MQRNNDSIFYPETKDTKKAGIKPLLPSHLCNIDKASDDDLSFAYDATGHPDSASPCANPSGPKKHIDIGSHGGTDPDITYYVRDATGNPIAHYHRHRVNNETRFT